MVWIHIQAGQGFIQQTPPLHLMDSYYVGVIFFTVTFFPILYVFFYLCFLPFSLKDSNPRTAIDLFFNFFFQCLHLLEEFHSAVSEFLFDPLCVCVHYLNHWNSMLIGFDTNISTNFHFLISPFLYGFSGGLARLLWRLTFHSFTFGWGVYAYRLFLFTAIY